MIGMLVSIHLLMCPLSSSSCLPMWSFVLVKTDVHGLTRFPELVGGPMDSSHGYLNGMRYVIVGKAVRD